MSYKTQIEMLTCSDNKQAYKVLKELLSICEQSNDLYMYFDKLVDMMNNKTNSFIRTRGLRLIAYNAKWDKENKINAIIEQWSRNMEYEKPITARQCIQDVIVIAKYKPELLDVILNTLENFDQIYDDSMQKPVYKDRQRAIQIISQYTW